MKIAFATFSNLPIPPTRGGAVESLINDICLQNEKMQQIDIDLYSIYEENAIEKSLGYNKTRFIFYKEKKVKKFSIKNITYKFFKICLPNSNMKSIIKMLNKEEYDFVITTSINREMQYIFKNIKSKTIWYLHGDPLSVLETKDLEKITKNSHGIICVSEFIKKQIQTIKNAKNIHTVLNCTDITPISKENEDSVRNQIRENANIKKDEILFTYIGRILPIKGILESVQSFCTINAKNAKFMIVGSPTTTEQQEYFKKIKSIANENIIFYGYANHDELNRIYCASDVIIAPSICKEAALLIGLEANVCKRPIITTNMGGIPEYISNKNAILIDVDENFNNSLQKAMLQFVNNSQPKFNFEENCFTQENLYKSFCNALESIKQENQDE